MKLNNKGFALTSIIYMLIVLFLMILLLILANLATRKVVLDKIKNDVKENLNQGGLLAQNTYTVTFDPTIGQINQKTKQVKYNEPYGELPTPTREGYKFIGWRGKNLFTGLVKGVGLSSTDGHQGTDNKMATSDYIPVDFTNEGYYLNGLSSNLRNFVAFYNENKEFMGRTNGVIVQNRYLVDSSSITNSATGVGGNISYIRITIYELDGYTTGTIDDIDNLNIQLEPGDTATSYEPYQEYTSDTIVTKQENHTLYAMWTENPKISLSKETYVDIPFDNTWTYSNATVEDNVLTLGSDGNNASAKTGFIDVNKEFWYVTMDGYSEVTLPDKDKNGIHFTMFYYDSNKSATNALSGANNNGSAINLNIGTWQENLKYKFPEYNRYGPNVNYIKLEFNSKLSSAYSKAPIKIRNLKVHGQMPNSFYLINVQATDNDGIDIIKCAKGIQNLEYFKENGTIVENNQARVTENGTYTIYVRDTKGGEKIETIEITNIE